MAPKLQPLPMLLFTALLTMLWGSVTFVTMIITIIYKGPSKFFSQKERNTRPACMDDPTLGTHEFVQLKDVKLHYVANGDKKNPLMLFLHGFPECWYSWRHQIREFSKDYRTVAVDMRGYGESDKPQGVINYHIDALSDDVAQLIEALGYKKCEVLVAHDWGGAVAVPFVLKYPQMASHLILCNIPHVAAFADHIKNHPSQLLKSWYIFMFQLPFLPEMNIRSNDFGMLNKVFGTRRPGAEQAPCSSEGDIEAYKYSLSRKDGLTCPINYYRASSRYEKSRKISSLIVEIPTLMIWGKKDAYLEYGMAEKSAKYCKDYMLCGIDAAGHWVQQESPKQTNEYMREFLTAKKMN